MNGGTPNGWFIVIIVDNPIKMDDNCGYPHDLGKLHTMLTSNYINVNIDMI